MDIKFGNISFKVKAVKDFSSRPVYNEGVRIGDLVTILAVVERIGYDAIADRPDISEYHEAVLLAHSVLDRIGADPDDDLAILARQLLRQIEANATLVEKISNKSDGYPCCEAVKRVEFISGDRTTLIGGWCPIHGKTFCHDA